MNTTQTKTDNLTKKFIVLTFSALFAALTTVMTAFLFHVPISLTGGYLHFGDACIYLAASLLPTPYAAVSAAIGGGLADVLSGAPIWAPFTLVIKALMVLPFTSKKSTILCKQNGFALVCGWFITSGGYYVAEALLYGNWVTPVYSLYGNFIQAAGSAALYILLALALDKMKIKNQLKLN